MKERKNQKIAIILRKILENNRNINEINRSFILLPIMLVIFK